MFLSRSPTRSETFSAPFHLVWRVYPCLDLIQMSGILSGIAALERRGAVSLEIEFVATAVSRSYPVMEFVVTERKLRRTRHIVLDFYDRADVIAPAALQFADIYFKRQFGAETQAAAGVAARKIVPLGLTVAGYTRATLRHVCFAILGSLRSADARHAGGGLSDVFRRAFSEARLWKALPPPDAAMLRDSDVKAPRIVFQPRLWPTTPGSGDQFDVANEDRIAMVRALKQAFPHERAVGLLRSETASTMAPDLLLPEHVTTERYYQQLRSSLVAVNCVGLSGSVGWKFAEYLAAGNAVVSPPIDKELLDPVVEGVHYLACHDPQECAALCRRLVSDDAMSRRMGDVNRRYFRESVNPPAHLSRLLSAAFA